MFIFYHFAVQILLKLPTKYLYQLGFTSCKSEKPWQYKKKKKTKDETHTEELIRQTSKKKNCQSILDLQTLRS